MEIKLTDVDLSALTKNLNIAKEMILQRLEKDGIISPSEKIFYSEEYQIIIIKPNWFKRWFEKVSSSIKKEDGDKYYFKLVNFSDE